MPKIDGWQTLATKSVDQQVDLAASARKLVIPEATSSEFQHDLRQAPVDTRPKSQRAASLATKKQRRKNPLSLKERCRWSARTGMCLVTATSS
jgi:hypothetical protein